MRHDKNIWRTPSKSDPGDLTLETLITFLTIENNNMNNYIVTFEYRVMVTAFAILAMFFMISLIMKTLCKTFITDICNVFFFCYNLEHMTYL